MGDSYRPRVRSRSPRRGFTGGANSNYRDRDFQFEHPRNLPARTHESEPQSYRDRGRRSDNFRPGSRGGGRGGRARGGKNDREPFRRTSYVPLPAHNRPILNVNFREKTPELLPGMVTTGEFETGEEEDDSEEEDDDEEPTAMSENEEPFTNEDPATLIEPVPEKLTGPITEMNSDGPKIEVVEGQEFVEADKKRMDVIQMIRQSKAKLAAEREKEAKKDSVAANDDFISLNFGDEEKSRLESQSENEGGRKRQKLNDQSKAAVQPPRIYQDVPNGKQFSHREHLHGPYVPKEPLDEGPPGIGTLSRAVKLPPPPGPSNNIRTALRKRSIDPYSSEETDDYEFDSGDDYDPENLRHEHHDVPQTRKRKYDEISKGKNLDGNIKPELRPKAGIDPIPWARDHSKTLHMTSWQVSALYSKYALTNGYPKAAQRNYRLHRVHQAATIRARSPAVCNPASPAYHQRALEGHRRPGLWLLRRRTIPPNIRR
jgi:non-canonical poly(A) RNA polymerase PAPD5/7